MKQFFFLTLAFFSTFCLANETESEKIRAVKYMVHEGTLLAEFDYATPTTLKTFEDYDFTVESSPCTVLGDYYDQKDENNTIYTIKIGSKDFKFMCRAVADMQSNERRLYMLGSVHDCLSRPFNFSTSGIEHYKQLGSMCEKQNRDKYLLQVDKLYLELFHPEKYYKLLALNTLK